MIRTEAVGITILALMAAVAGNAAQGQEPKSSVAPAPQSVTSEHSGTDSTRDQVVLHHRNPRYQLHSADVLQLSFPFTPEFDQTVTIQPDGYISLRGLDSIHVAGQTLPEVTESVKKAYSKILHDPDVNVELKDFEKPFFIVGGEVGHPGKFDLRESTTANEAVAIAGGFKDSSKHSEVLLFHRVEGGWVQARKINMKKMMKEGDLNEDSYLQPGDFLYVPKNAFSKYSRFIPTSSLGIYANPGVL